MRMVYEPSSSFVWQYLFRQHHRSLCFDFPAKSEIDWRYWGFGSSTVERCRIVLARAEQAGSSLPMADHYHAVKPGFIVTWFHWVEGNLSLVISFPFQLNSRLLRLVQTFVWNILALSEQPLDTERVWFGDEYLLLKLKSIFYGELRSNERSPG